MMTKFTFATQPRYDRTHGNITYSADSQPSRFSFNIRIVYIKTHTAFQFGSSRFFNIFTSISLYYDHYQRRDHRSGRFSKSILKKNRILQSYSFFLTHPIHIKRARSFFSLLFIHTVLPLFVFFFSFLLSFFFRPLFH